MINKLKEIIPFSLRRKLNLSLHRGALYTCPFCKYSSKDLAEIGIDVPVLVEKQVIGSGKRFGGCFKCGSTDRERLVFVFLRDKLKIFEPQSIKAILHIAPERNLSKKLLAFNFSKYVCGDLFTVGYKYPAHVQNIDILDIPFEDSSFDLIICNHVLEHIPSDLNAMKELQRVLKIGGKAILQVPISANSSHTFEDFSITEPKEREKMFGQFDHIRIYGQDYLDRLQLAKFSVERINIASEYPSYGLNPAEDIIIASKI